MWRSTFKRSARRSWINQENEVYSLTQATGGSLKKKNSWMKSASSFREDWECRFPLDHYHRNLAIWGRAELQKGSPPAPFEKALEIWRKRRSCCLLCSWRASKENTWPKSLTDALLMEAVQLGRFWCPGARTPKQTKLFARYFGNEQLTTLSTANRACEEGQCL